MSVEWLHATYPDVATVEGLRQLHSLGDPSFVSPLVLLERQERPCLNSNSIS